MSKQSLLLVDGDPRSLRVLEVSLRKAGFSVVTAESARAAQEKIVVAAPDLIISEIKLDDGDGFELCRRVRSTPRWQDIPFMFLTGEVGIENKIRGLELGVDEYLTKPIYIKEIVTRIHMLLQKRQRARIEERKDQRTRFVGRIADMPVVDVIQTIEVSRKSGVIHFVGERNRQAAIYFRDGKVIDAEAGPLTAENAVYRLLTWSEGDFEVVFRTVRRREVIEIGSQALLMEGMRRLDEWTRLLEQLPPLTTHVDLKLDLLASKLGEIPDESNRLLRLIDGRRSLMAVIDACDLGDLEALQAIAQLHAQKLLVEVEASTQEEESRPALSLETVVARARSEESGPNAVPTVTPSSLPIATDSLAGAPVGFRPSGLRLVDEAVAAAQAIDPELAAWPEPGAVARTITGRARTISQITSFSPAAQDSLPMARERAPRARTEPGPGYNVDARVQVEIPAATEPSRRARSITGQPVPVAPRAIKTPPYGARVVSDELHAVEPPPPEVPRTPARVFAAVVPEPEPNEALPTDQRPTANLVAVQPQSGEEDSSPALQSKGAPLVARATTRPTLPPGSGTSGALARKRRSSPPPSRPAASEAKPATIARITTEQRAVRVPEITERRDTRRMITSLGAATAEVSGELEAPQPAREAQPETQRQMVTILPRRITREVPVLPKPPERAVEVAPELESAAQKTEDRAEAAGSQGSNGSPRAVLVRRRVTEPGQEPAKEAPVTASSRRITREVPAATAADVVAEEAPPLAAVAAGTLDVSEAPSKDADAPPPEAAAAPEEALVEEAHGAPAITPSWSPAQRSMVHRTTAVLFGLAGVLALVATALWLRGRSAERKRATPPPPAVAAPKLAAKSPCATPPSTPCPPETPQVVSSKVDAGVDAATQPDAATAVAPAVDAAPPSIEPAPPITAKPDPAKEAKALLQKARKALSEGNHTGALLHADEALALKKSARAYLVRAAALQGLVRLEDALASIDRAIALADGHAEGWLARGRVLDVLGRTGEAKAAFTRFLELAPTGPASDEVRRRLGQ